MAGNFPPEEPTSEAFVFPRPPNRTFLILAPGIEATTQAILAAVFGLEYVSADGCQVSPRVVLRLHALLHAR
jgi:hypothetical protein